MGGGWICVCFKNHVTLLSNKHDSIMSTSGKCKAEGVLKEFSLDWWWEKVIS